MYEKVQINTSNLKIFDWIKGLFIPHPIFNSLLQKLYRSYHKNVFNQVLCMLQELYWGLCRGGMAVVQLDWWEVCSIYRVSASASSRPMCHSSSSAMDFLLVQRFFYHYSEKNIVDIIRATSMVHVIPLRHWRISLCSGNSEQYI